MKKTKKQLGDYTFLLEDIYYKDEILGNFYRGTRTKPPNDGLPVLIKMIKISLLRDAKNQSGLKESLNSYYNKIPKENYLVPLDFLISPNYLYCVYEYYGDSISLVDYMKALMEFKHEMLFDTLLFPIIIALQNLHEKQLIHGLLSPFNIWVKTKGNWEIEDFKIINYGLFDAFQYIPLKSLQESKVQMTFFAPEIYSKEEIISPTTISKILML